MYGGPEFFHPFFSSSILSFFRSPALNSLYFLFVNELIAVRQVFHIIIDALIDEFGRPSFALHVAEELLQVLLQSTHRPGTVSAGGFWEAVDQFFKSWIFFKFGNGIERRFSKNDRFS